MKNRPRYFDDTAGQARRFALATVLLSAFVLLYVVGTFAGLLYP